MITFRLHSVFVCTNRLSWITQDISNEGPDRFTPQYTGQPHISHIRHVTVGTNSSRTHESSTETGCFNWWKNWTEPLVHPLKEKFKADPARRFWAHQSGSTFHWITQKTSVFMRYEHNSLLVSFYCLFITSFSKNFSNPYVRNWKWFIECTTLCLAREKGFLYSSCSWSPSAFPNGTTWHPFRTMPSATSLPGHEWHLFIHEEAGGGQKSHAKHRAKSYSNPPGNVPLW